MSIRHRPTPQQVEQKVNAAKQSIAQAIRDYLDKAQMTQTEACYITGDAPSQYSLVTSGATDPAKLWGFSLERLLRMYVSLTGRTVLLSAIGPSREIVRFRQSA